ncbi:LacI family transcriptional regulator, partial [Kribbella turkmenica]
MTARMRDVARRAGVSVKTVSNVINHYPHVTPETRAKVQAAIADLDYRPNLGARSLRKGRCGVIALVVPDLTPPYFAALAAAVARAAKKTGVAVLIEQTDGDPTAEESALNGLRDRLVDGILLWPTASAGRSPSPT